MDDGALVGKLSRSVWFGRIGKIVAMAFLVLAAAWVPGAAWLERHDAARFDSKVGWANILALSVGALGVVLTFLDKWRSANHPSKDQLKEVAERLADEVLRLEGTQLARLLATDRLDSRPAAVRFVLSTTGRRGKSRPSNRGVSKGGDLGEVAEFFLAQTRGRLVILGEPGSGKTVLARSLLVGLLQKRELDRSSSQGDSGIGVPVYFNLASWSADLDAYGWLTGQLAERYRLSREVCITLLRRRVIIPILDGLDELDSEEVSDRALLVVAKINDYIAQNPGVRLVVVCRSGSRYYGRFGQGVRDADEIVLKPLTVPQSIEYISMHCRGEADQEAWSTLFSKLRGAGASEVKRLLSNPWKLSVAVQFYLTGGDPNALLPLESVKGDGRRVKESQACYSDRIESLLLESYVQAKVRLYGTKRYSPDVAQRYLRAIASMMTSGKSPTSQIVLHHLLDIVPEQAFSRTYKYSFWLMCHVPFFVYGIVNNFGSFWEEEGVWSWLDIAIFFSNYLFLVSLIARHGPSRARRPSRLRLGRLRNPRALLIMVAGILFALLVSFMGSFKPWYGISMGILVFLGISLMALGDSSAAQASDLGPRAPLRYDTVYALMGAVLAGLFYGVYIGEMIGFTGGLLLGLLAFSGWLYSSSAAHYLIAAHVTRMKFGFPFFVGRFLDWAQSAGLMRISGLGYEFRHAELQSFLATSHEVRGSANPSDQRERGQAGLVLSAHS
ncbi:NACHT domain-containing protein [Micromonospora sp. NBC_01405]|uniref:NACHT domain-containing protein n=1 Tax=Micromonospora sp. NBC_01405 TaxID=2903589 RepID=UPI00324CBB32